MPKVSIIIPAHNSAATLGQCLSSLRIQSHSDIEIIVADDASTDRTAAIAAEYAAKVVVINERSGAGKARNLAAKESTGEILAFTDSDVVVPPDWIGNFLKTMAEKRGKCVAGGYSGSIGNAPIQTFAFLELEYRRRSIGERVFTFPSSNFACTRELFFSVNGFPENYKAASLEDMVFSYKVSRDHPVYWSRDNGVLHQFRDSLRKYLRQQYIFARDTVLTYLDFPRLLRIRTHQGRQLYIETAITFLAFAGLFLSPYALPAGILAIALMNLGFISYAQKRQSVPSLYFFLIVLCRNFACGIGVISGFVRSIVK